MTDFAIVHITDLHYPVNGDPVWKEPFMTAIERLPDDTVTVKGIAVTGDLVNSPNATGFKNAAAFLSSVAAKLLPSLSPEER